MNVLSKQFLPPEKGQSEGSSSQRIPELCFHTRKGMITDSGSKFVLVLISLLAKAIRIAPKKASPYKLKDFTIVESISCRNPRGTIFLKDLKRRREK
ncbi:hypothetical protein CK203_010584 [Vitis vinifera]|uniref:Uncharacterized protein n=1 Tax=Vitis vinifera TaxID=29760 RepID=A0A438JTK4_VITVI|nr:hypothetical protein CK203_010584 [Vitis vinifera]